MIRKLKEYDVDSMPRKQYDDLEKKFTSIPEFNPEKIKKVS